ncbi:Nas6 [Kluyveromyces lactis]|nr:Nas6 [Kluyveromyces lactis]
MGAEFLLHAACMKGETEKVQQILSEFPGAVKVKDDDGRYPLHWAVSFQQDNIIDILLSYMKKIDLDTILDESGWSPVHIASSIGSVTILEKLLNHTVEPNLDLQANNGITALHLACSKKHLNVVQLLVDRGASVRIKDGLGQLPLHRAAASGSVGIVSILCDKNSPVNIKDKNGWSPLFHALAEGHGDVAVTLVNKYHALWEGETDNDDLSIDKICVDAKVKDYFLSKVE